MNRDTIHKLDAYCYGPGFMGVRKEDIDEMPTTEQSERKKGEWIWDENAIDWGIGAWICSECKNDPQTYWSTDKANDPYEWGSSQYCPNCGAKMQRGETR